jgi:hypothetical protein
MKSDGYFEPIDFWDLESLRKALPNDEHIEAFIQEGEAAIREAEEED